jgi:hypothetical protein
MLGTFSSTKASASDSTTNRQNSWTRSRRESARGSEGGAGRSDTARTRAPEARFGASLSPVRSFGKRLAGRTTDENKRIRWTEPRQTSEIIAAQIEHARAYNLRCSMPGGIKSSSLTSDLVKVYEEADVRPGERRT